MIIAFPSKPSKQGGPGSFQRKIEVNLKSLGWKVVYPDDKVTPDVIMIFGGTKRLIWVLRMKIKGAKIIFRLGGINWLYKVKSIPFFRRVYLEIQIFFTPIIQKYLGSGIIYQSAFSKEWLLKLKQSAVINHNIIIYNGVDINEFKPARVLDKNDISLLCIEGNIDYSPFAVDVLNQLQEKLISNSGYKSIILYGNFENPSNKNKLHPLIDYKGFIPGDEIHKVYRNAVYLSLDVNPACPNAVIEALASGIPVIGYDTGALKELVPTEAGEIVPYGGDPWKPDFPDVSNLINAANKVLNNWQSYSNNARKIAEKLFDLRYTTSKYLNFILTTNK